MSRKRLVWTIAGVLAGIVILVCVAGVLALRSQWFFERVRRYVVTTVETATGGRVEAASFRFDWTQMRAELDGLTVHGTEPPDKPPLFRAASVAVGLRVVSI